MIETYNQKGFDKSEANFKVRKTDKSLLLKNGLSAETITDVKY